MTGQPKFRREDLVTFPVTIDGRTVKLNGAIYVVDAMGIPGQTDEPSYDIEAVHEGDIILFKHIRESLITARTVESI